MKIININKSYEGKPVLNNVNLELEKGHSYCIMGASGRGKTTLLHILLGLVKPDSGTLEGFSHKKAAVFQEDRLCEEFSAFINVWMVTNKVEKQTVRKELERLLPKESIDAPVSTLSGGMKRRTAIVRALMADGDIIFMDEPFSGLDEKTKKNVMDYIKEKTENKTLIMSTHNKADAVYMESKVITLD